MLVLAELQNKCKRDPSAYREEFLMQLNHFESQLKLFQLQPSKDMDSFKDQVVFLANVASSYRDDMKEFPSQLSNLLQNHAFIMKPEVRKDIVQSLILLRNREFIPPIDLLSLLFKLFRVPDKQLRTLLYKHIIADIRNKNQKHKDNKLNSALQSFMFTMLQDTSEIAAKKSHEVLIDLYERHIWNDAKTVNAISTGIFSKNPKIVAATCRFFLGSDDDDDDSDAEEDDNSQELQEAKKLLKIKYRAGINRKSRKRARHMKNELDKIKKKDKKKFQGNNFPALDLLNDPQGYAEKVFNRVKKSTERFELRLMMLNLVSRLMNYHKLFMETFYTFLQSYLRPKQQNITYLLAVVAQSVHDLIPPEELQPIISEICHHFISDHCPNEAIAIGINTIREICVRNPLVISQDLLSDLVQYKNHKDKGVVMAARSLINFFREKHPAMLHRKDRGKDHDIDAVPLAYGQEAIPTGIEGIELLEEFKDMDADEIDQLVSDSEEEDIADEELEGNEKSQRDGDSDDGEEVEDEDIELEDGEDIEFDEDEDGDVIEDGEDDEEADEGEESEEGDDDEGEFVDISVIEKLNAEMDRKRGRQPPQKNKKEEVESDEEVQPAPKKLKTKAAPKEQAATPKEIKEKPNEVSVTPEKINLGASRILTEEELTKLKKLKEKFGPKRSRDDMESESPNKRTNFLDPSSLAGSTRKKQNYEERLAHIKAGREGQEKPLGHARSFKKNKIGSRTNEEKLKNKPFMLTKNKKAVRDKVKRSLREKQSAKTAHIKTMKNQKKYKH
eukprot:TRINITY_DN2151_c0_g1_i1.p1 TRINITY_DN2151_c0_g1~~TRINITY_DN2151_c0_g1_i1.p1  ORF type:complete len:785 (-),score=300.13 TRINITY_DN2151_c0_g1_i1:33-2387(-)